MARRSRSSDEELPFVALMDTLTNVVGVLIIVMVMIGIGLAKAVNKVLSDLPPVTLEEHAKLQNAVEKTKPEKSPEAVDKEIAKLLEEMQKAQKELEQTHTPEQAELAAKIFEIQKKIEALKKERDLKKAAVEKLLAEIDKLKKQLDETPVYVPPPDIIVKIPHPRPIPDKAVVQNFLINGDHIVYVNPQDYRNLVIQELKGNEGALSPHNETVKDKDGKPVMQKDPSGRVSPQKKVTYDPRRLADFFTRARLTGRTLNLSGRDITIEVTPAPDSPNIPVKLIVPPTAGETLDQAKNLTSEFQTLLRKFKDDPRTVIWIKIGPKGIPTYLGLRDLVDRAGLPITWDFDSSSVLNFMLPPDFAVTYTPKPPPVATPTPANQAPTPPPIIIKPPKPTLD